MKIAITGGTGLIGGKLALRHLALGDEVRVLARKESANIMLPKEFDLYFGDLHSCDILQPFVDGVDVLYHCAGEIRNASSMHATHVEGTKNLIVAAKARIGRWVQLSSVGAYGQHRAGVIIESTPLNPSGSYETTKAASDLLVESAGRDGMFSYAILRPSNVYGEDMKNQSLFSLIKMIKHGLFFYIGKDNARANYIHVDNVVEAMFLCATRPQAKGEIYNLSDSCSLEHFVTVIADALSVPIPRARIPEWIAWCIAKSLGLLPRFPLTSARIDALTIQSSYSTDKIMRELGYKQVVSMDNGLKEMVRAFQKDKK